MMKVVAMGIWDRIKGLFKGGKKEPRARYILKMKTEKGGWRSVAEFDHPITMQEFLQLAESGEIMVYNRAEYRLDEYVEGTRGAKTLWGPVQYVSEEEEALEPEIKEERIKPRRRREPFRDLESFLEELESQLEVLDRLSALGVRLAKLGGRTVIDVPSNKSVEDFLVDQMAKLKEKYDRLSEIFGSSKLRAEETEIPVEGKVPASLVFALKYAPDAIDKVMDKVERRLKRMGLLGGGGEYQTITVPPFPDVNAYLQSRGEYIREQLSRSQFPQVAVNSGESRGVEDHVRVSRFPELPREVNAGEEGAGVKSLPDQLGVGREKGVKKERFEVEVEDFSKKESEEVSGEVAEGEEVSEEGGEVVRDEESEGFGE